MGASSLGSIVIGTYDLTVSYPGVDDKPTNLFNEKSLDYKDADQFVYLFTGSMASPTIQTVHFTDPFITGGTPPGSVAVWFADAASTPGQVDVYLTSPDTPMAGATPTATVTAQGYSQPITLDNLANWRLRVTPSGSTDVLFDSGSFALAGGTRTLFTVTDYFGPPGTQPLLLNATAVTSTGAQQFPADNLPSKLRIIDLVRDQPALDVYFGSTSAAPFASNLTLLDTTAYQTVVPGTTSLNLTAHGVASPALLEKDTQFYGGAYYTLLLTGSYNGGGTASTLGSVLFAADRRPIQGRTTVNFVNADNVNTAVNVYFLTPSQTITDISPQVADAESNTLHTTTLLSGVIDVVVTSTDNTNTIIGPQQIVLNQGSTYSLVLVQDVAGQAKLMVLQDSPIS